MRRGAYHLQLGRLWRSRGQGHTRIASDIIGSVTLDIIHDHVDKRSLELIITSREEWKDDGDTLLLSDILWFTDGSQTKDGIVAGIL